MAGLVLARRGRAVRILEAAPTVGGMAGSFEVAGQRVDFGSHRLHPSCPPDLLALLGELLGDDLQRRPRSGRIRLAGRWLGFPLGAADLLRGLPPATAARAAVDTITGPLRSRRAGGDTFIDELRRRLGPTVTELFYAPYARKLWGVDGSELDAELARRRVSAPSGLAIVRKAIGGGPRREFLYPRRGYGQIVEALADAAVEAGATITLSQSVGDPAGFDAATTIWTAPLGPLLASAPSGVQAAARRLDVRAMVLVYLVVPQRQWTAFDAHYFPGLDTVVARVSEAKNYRDGPDPAGITVLCAEVPCTAGDQTWSATDADLAAQVAEELAAQGLPRPPVDGAVVRRLPSVYPVYRRGFRAQTAVVDQWVSSLDRVLVTGRQSLFVPDNLHHVLAMGRDAAAAVGPSGTIDRAAWSAALTRFSAHVVED